ncbi:MAG: palindromic element RPE4 domain-containing protein [Alphaproteobacteria bacterium]|nr:palindromic element RPE4 domain-containing protein [Alphaproteobacteria bacterium]
MNKSLSQEVQTEFFAKKILSSRGLTTGPRSYFLFICFHLDSGVKPRNDKNVKRFC